MFELIFIESLLNRYIKALSQSSIKILHDLSYKNTIGMFKIFQLTKKLMILNVNFSYFNFTAYIKE